MRLTDRTQRRNCDRAASIEVLDARLGKGLDPVTGDSLPSRGERELNSHCSDCHDHRRLKIPAGHTHQPPSSATPASDPGAPELVHRLARGRALS